jgi:hypothetical protein
MSAAQQLATTSVEQIGSGGIYTTAVTIEAPAPGFLCVKVLTDKLLKEQKGLTVKFYPSDTSGAIKGDQIGADATTDEKGVAGVDKRMPSGYFACVVDGITARVRPIDVDTYEEASAKPYPLGLPRGFLAVRLLFRNLPLKDFKVRFFEAGADGAKKGSALGTAPEADKGLPTDANGMVALVGDEFKLGNFLCEVDGKWLAAVSTVEEVKRPYVLSLPLVRPLVPYQATGRVEAGADVLERPEATSGYLSVKVLFRDLPVAGRNVTFYPSGADGRAAADQPKGEALTDNEGVATLSDKALLGNYFCQVEGQDGFASLGTVEDPKRPYVVSLPLVRPFMAYRVPGEVKAVADVAERPDAPTGHLSVKVLFRGVPVTGSRVTFYASGPDGKPVTGEGAAGDALTDDEGVATLDSKAALGNYFCLVEGQSAYASISTVEDKKQPYVVLLPPGRPLLTVREAGRIEPPVGEVAERPASAGSYLSVMVLFRNAPVAGRTVHFFASAPDGTADLAQQKGEAVTDNLGIATLEATAQLGVYFCQVDGQSGYVSIGTVEDKDLPYVVNLPQGRPFLAPTKPGAITGLKDVEELDPPEEKT